MAIQPLFPSAPALHGVDVALDEQALFAADQLYLEREVDAMVLPGRRSFLGSAVRLTAGGAALAVGGEGIMQMLEGAGGLVQRAEGAERAVPVLHPPAAPLPPRAAVATVADRHEWDLFRRRFVAADGRVVDTGNGGISHTEGQGWGMLFAVGADDQSSFQSILAWTSRNLRRPHDALHAWRYVPGDAQPVADLNNATDGDLSIASALWRASFRWNRPDYAEQARAIARDILRLLVRTAGPRTVLLPAAFGFEKAGVVTVNPSYYCFTAMQELSEALPSPIWARLRDDGVALIADGRFGSWRLPPDWLSVSCRDGGLAPAPGWPARFSYDAVRVPLQLAWAGLTQPAMRASFIGYWRETSHATAWIDLRTNDRANYPAPPGIIAVAKIATAPEKSALPHDFPSIRSSPDYYSAALTLLARLAWQEIMLV